MADGMRTSIVAYDPTGHEVARNDSVMSGQMAFIHDELIFLKDDMIRIEEKGPNLGVKKPFLGIYSSDLRPEGSIETVERGYAFIVRSVGEGRINIQRGPGSVLAGNGKTLLVKEPLNDTLSHYENGILTPAYILDSGNHTIPDGALGMDPTVPTGDSYAVRNVYESDGFLFVEAHGYKDDKTVRLIFDSKDPLTGGFSATGPDGKPGLFIGGVAFKPMYVRDNRLVGYMQALDIVDGAAAITNPDLATLAAKLREDSNPVIVVVKLK
jgi:hypothetical protein